MDFALNKLQQLLCRITVLAKVIGKISQSTGQLNLPLETLKSITEH